MSSLALGDVKQIPNPRSDDRVIDRVSGSSPQEAHVLDNIDGTGWKRSTIRLEHRRVGTTSITAASLMRRIDEVIDKSETERPEALARQRRSLRLEATRKLQPRRPGRQRLIHNANLILAEDLRD